jgi:hypothetical protein
VASKIIEEATIITEAEEAAEVVVEEEEVCLTKVTNLDHT